MQKHSRLLIEELAKHPGVEITVLHPHPVSVFNLPSVNEISLKPIDASKTYLLECYRYSVQVAKHLMSINPDVIYSQGLSVWADINKFCDRLIVNPHGLEPYQALGTKNKLMGIPFRLVFNYIFSKSCFVVSLGGKLTKILEKNIADRNKITEIPNAVDKFNYSSKRLFNKQKIKVLFLARFAHNKGINIVFEAVEMLRKEGNLKHFEFILGGKGPLYDYYLMQNICDEVKLLGFVPDEKVEELFAENDIFILPTLFEGMPTVVLEAMSTGMPVIVSDVGATALLVDETNGRLIKPGSAKALAKALVDLHSMSSNELKEMGMKGRVKVEKNFTWEKVAAKHMYLFRKVIEVNAENRN